MKAFKHNSKGLYFIVTDFIALFFPRYCMGCADTLMKGEEIVCTACILDLPKTNYHLHSTNPIKERLSLRVDIENAFAFLKFNKKGAVQNLLHQLKYNNQPEIGIALGKIYGKDLVDSKKIADYDFLVPVPLHLARERKRGYNQSAKFAEGLSLHFKIPVIQNAFIRTKQTSTQTKKTRVERWENVKAAFQISEPAQVKDKSIILVDDVITTGATIEALCQRLIEAGCQRITIICLAEA